jgi:DNA-binding transcriptional MerR regulator
MSGQEGKYNIKAVSKLLGIQPGTLRAWERRYQMIAPVRNELGYRLYTEEQIKVLKWLLKKVDEGFTIGQAVSLLEKDPLNSEMETLPDGNQLHSLSGELLNYLLDFNEEKAQEQINLVFSLYSVEKVIFEIFDDILEKTTQLWETNKISKAQKYYAHTIIRSKIESIFYSMPQNYFARKAVSVCCPQEKSNLRLLLMSVYLRRKGWEVIYIGTSISEEEIEKLLKSIRPDYLFCSCELQENLTSALTLAAQLSLNHQNLRIGLCGNAVNSMKKSEKAQFSSFIVGEYQSDWEKWLE